MTRKLRPERQALRDAIKALPPLTDEEEAEIDRFPCAHNAAGYVLAALAECYADCLEQSGADRRTS